jgi:hypothetical protein
VKGRKLSKKSLGKSLDAVPLGQEKSFDFEVTLSEEQSTALVTYDCTE